MADLTLVPSQGERVQLMSVLAGLRLTMGKSQSVLEIKFNAHYHAH